MKEQRFRNKVTWFSFLFSMLVIWVHSYNAELYLGEGNALSALAGRLERGLGNGVGQIAVPGFFMMSGYLFYRNCTWEKIGGKLKRRIKSVLVPYILWNFLYYLGYVAASRLPWLGQVVGKGVIPFGLLPAVDAIIHYTYNYVFWYLFQLILLILLAPLLYPLLRFLWSRVLLYVCLWGLVILGIRLPYLNADAAVYYTTGAILAMSGSHLVESEEHPFLPGAALAVMAVLFYRTGLSHAWIFCFVLCRLCAVAGLWLLLPAKSLPEAKGYMGCNFFLYATHFALVRLINKSVVQLFYGSMAAALGLYVAMPFLVLAVVYPVGMLLRRYLPSVWILLNGAR